MSAPHVIEKILGRDSLAVVLVLTAIIAGSWLYVLFGAGTGMYPHNMAMLVPPQTGAAPSMPASSWTLAYALIMFVMWWLMMIAMMLPSAAPMVLLHASIWRKNTEQDAPLRPSLAFVSGYLVLWGAFSLLAVFAQWALERGGLLNAMMMPTSSLPGAVLLLAAGVWQLTPIKAACLKQCRSPMSFVSAYWRPGIGGAFAMGARHGVFCLGCCWFLMALLFYGGVMNLVWIMGLAAFVLIEKLVPSGVAFGRISGVLFIGWGLWLAWSAF